jgi:hypothetical protein
MSVASVNPNATVKILLLLLRFKSLLLHMKHVCFTEHTMAHEQGEANCNIVNVNNGDALPFAGTGLKTMANKSYYYEEERT